jgi:hypothetical protein
MVNEHFGTRLPATSAQKRDRFVPKCDLGGFLLTKHIETRYARYMMEPELAHLIEKRLDIEFKVQKEGLSELDIIRTKGARQCREQLGILAKRAQGMLFDHDEGVVLNGAKWAAALVYADAFKDTLAVATYAGSPELRLAALLAAREFAFYRKPAINKEHWMFLEQSALDMEFIRSNDVVYGMISATALWILALGTRGSEGAGRFRGIIGEAKKKLDALCNKDASMRFEIGNIEKRLVDADPEFSLGVRLI